MTPESVAIDLLQRVTTPSLGSHSKKDLELLLIEFFVQHGVLTKDLTEFEMVSKLKITRSKARGLLYERELRSYNESTLQLKLVEVLTSPSLYVHNGGIFLNVESSLLRDYVRDKLASMRQATDASFNPSLIRLNESALGALIEISIDQKAARELKKYLVRTKVVKDTSVKGYVAYLVRGYIKAKAGDGADEILGALGDWVRKLFDGQPDELSALTFQEE